MVVKIPKVNLRSLGINTASPQPKDLRIVGTELANGFADIGFAYITNHGLSRAAVQAANHHSSAFFNFPTEIKTKYSRGIDRIQGYSGVGMERLSTDRKVELRESFDVTCPEGKGFPDDLLPSFRGAVITLTGELVALARRLILALEYGLRVEECALQKTHGQILQGPEYNASAIRLLNYPPLQFDNEDNGDMEGAIRCATHTDYGTLTILMQDDMGGLEVRQRSGEWLQATPVPGALLINVGEVLQMLTKNHLVATEHRVKVPQEEVKRKCARRSIAFFVHPDRKVFLRPLDGSEGEKITAGEHVDRRFSETYA